MTIQDTDRPLMGPKKVKNANALQAGLLLLLLSLLNFTLLSFGWEIFTYPDM